MSSTPRDATKQAEAAPEHGLLDQEVHRRIMSSFRLQLKLVVMVAIILLVLGTIVFVLVERIFDALTPSIRHDLEWKARHAVIELANTGALGVIANDAEAVSAAARELIADADVVAVQVTGRDGPVLSHGEVPFAWDAVTHAAEGSVIERDGLLVAAGPVEIEGLQIGRVTLAVSTQRLLAGRQLRSDILSAGAFGALFAFGLALLFVRYDIAPLIRLTADAFAKLERTTVAALESARVKSEFLANMSHEIRTPMNGIMGVTKLLLLMPMEAKMRRYVEVIDSSARGLLTIINDVLDFSKLEAGKYKIRPVGFEPRTLVGDCVTLFDGRARERGLSLSAEVAADVPQWLVGDPDRIRQILDNLVGNAVKFTCVGEVTLHVALEREDEQLLLHARVRDTGIGIGAEDQRRLFQAFTQVDGSSVRVHGGTGLGLAIVKHLVGLMHGQVGLRSELGHGSEFWVKIRVEPFAGQPASQAHASAHNDGATAPTATAPAAPILVVDDNEINRLVAVEHLHHLGYAAETANNGAEAVEAVFRRPYALVLMDCQMPVMDGYSAASVIRERERAQGRSRIPIIALTAHVLDGERERVMGAGMDEHMPKPIHLPTLQSLVAQFLGARPRSAPPPSGAQSPMPESAAVVGAPPANQQADELPAVLECSPNIVALFLRLAPAQLAELKDSIGAGDAIRARERAHKFKGALYSVSANALATSVETLREEISAADWVAVQTHFDQIALRFEGLCGQLKQRAAAS